MTEYRYDQQYCDLYRFNKEIDGWIFVHNANDSATKEEAIIEYENGEEQKNLTVPSDKGNYDESTETFQNDPLNISTSYDIFTALSLSKYKDINEHICVKADDAYKETNGRFKNLYFRNDDEMRVFFDEVDENWRKHQIYTLNEIFRMTDNED